MSMFDPRYEWDLGFNIVDIINAIMKGRKIIGSSLKKKG